MTTNPRDHDSLGPDERRALAAARLDRRPPADLEARVMQAIAEDAGIAAPAAHSTQTRLSAALAAAAVFLLGVWLGTSLPGSKAPATRPAPSTAARFMLLLYEDANYQAASDPASRVREYATWARELGQSGSLVSGDELGDGGVQVTKTTAPAALSPGQTSDQPRGYFVITAPDAAAATRVAATCPHLKYGGRIVVRKIPL